MEAAAQSQCSGAGLPPPMPVDMSMYYDASGAGLQSQLDEVPMLLVKRPELALCWLIIARASGDGVAVTREM